MNNKTILVLALCALLLIVNAAVVTAYSRPSVVWTPTKVPPLTSALNRNQTSAAPFLPHSAHAHYNNTAAVRPMHTLTYTGDKCTSTIQDFVSLTQRKTSCRYWLHDRQGNDWSCQDGKTLVCKGYECPRVACMGSKGTLVN